MFGRIVTKNKVEMKTRTHAVDETDPIDQCGYVKSNAGHFAGMQMTVQQERRNV